MSQELFESIVDQVVAVGGRRLVVFLSNYNEPTIDPLFEERCRVLFARGLPVSHPDQRVALRPRPGRAAARRWAGSATSGSTCRPSTRSATSGSTERGTSTRVLANVDAHARARARRGDGDRRPRGGGRRAPPRRRGDPRRGSARRAGRSGRSGSGAGPSSGTFVPEPPAKKNLRGCELMGSRPFEHLHVTATAKAVLCCQDYYERLTVGDLKTQTRRGDARAATRWRGCAAGPTAWKRRRRTSSAAAASSRSESDDAEHVPAGTHAALRPSQSGRVDRKTYRLYDAAGGPAEGASPAPAAAPRLPRPLRRLLRAARGQGARAHRRERRRASRRC